MTPIDAASYSEFLRRARKAARRSDEAEDLLQTVLLAAIEAGRADLRLAADRRWLTGALRKRALFDARSAARRRRREAAAELEGDGRPESRACAASFVPTLPPSLRTTALLALTGHARVEIAWLQRLTDAALRQRIAEIRRRWRAAGGGEVAELQGLKGPLAFGRMRRSLLAPVRRQGAQLASHDPDGHLFVVTSQTGGSRQHRVGAAPGKA